MSRTLDLCLLGSLTTISRHVSIYINLAFAHKHGIHIDCRKCKTFLNQTIDKSLTCANKLIRILKEIELCNIMLRGVGGGGGGGRIREYCEKFRTIFDLILC